MQQSKAARLILLKNGSRRHKVICRLLRLIRHYKLLQAGKSCFPYVGSIFLATQMTIIYAAPYRAKLV